MTDPSDAVLVDPADEVPVDVPAPRPVLSSELVYRGAVWDVLSDTVDLGVAGVVRRDRLHHPGAVTVLALDDQDRVLMILQYRHPTGMELWELPAGLLDVAGESPLLGAQRELAEEADLTADRWDLLVDWFNSPGGSDEAVRLFLARGVHSIPEPERHIRTGEELDMPTRWIPLEQARDAVLAGKIHNAGSVVGILAACAARELGWSTLRPVDSPWPEHHAFR
jgi:ADP-ribose pyrophosphatase